MIGVKRIFFFLMCAIFLASPVFASELTVEKIVKEENISVGSPVTVVLRFDNPFDYDIPVRIVDKNIFANNGLNVECLEQTIPKKSMVDVEYQPITAYAEGSYTLERARVNYTDPLTKKDTKIESNKHDIKVEEGASNVQAEGITSIYQCDNISMQSTSYSSSQSSQQSQTEEEQQQQEEQQQNTQDKLQNIDQQNPQNMQELKQEMQEEMQRQEAQKQEMMKQIESDPKTYEEHQQLQEEGYQLSEKNVNPTSEDSGEFDYKYQKENGDTASIKGDINNGSVENVSSWSSDKERRMMNALENSTEFKETVSELEKEGFELENKSISPASSNMTNFQYQMSNPNTNATAQIHGNMTTQGNVTSLVVEKDGDKRSPWCILYLIAGALIGYYVWQKYLQKEKVVPLAEAPERKKHIDYKKDALRMLDSAEKMFASGRKKDAYEKVSYAIRFYFKHELESDKKELTATDALNLIRGAGRWDKKKIKQFFDICNQVNFAKYEANKEDFEKILQIGKGVVG